MGPFFSPSFSFIFFLFPALISPCSSASRFRILAADFCAFSQSSGADAYACKGVLGVKLQLQPGRVAFVYTTHLQAGSRAATRRIRLAQIEQMWQFCEVAVSLPRTSLGN